MRVKKELKARTEINKEARSKRTPKANTKRARAKRGLKARIKIARAKRVLTA